MKTSSKPRRTRKYFAPQTDDIKTEHHCDYPGCNKKGEYRAPKDRSLKEYYWFCLEHVQQYNSKWNYYDGISDQAAADDDEEKPRRKSRFKFNANSRVKYKFGYNLKDDFDFFGEYASDFTSMDDVFYNQEEKKFLEIMELDSKGLDITALKKQYKKLAKKYHPDIHQGDKKMEEKFKQLTAAYQALLSKFV